MVKHLKNLSNQIGKAIAHRRIAAGLTQDEIAEKLGVGYEAVSRMERGITIPTVFRLAELSEIFNCGIDELLIESSNRPNDQAKSIQKMLEKLSDKDRDMVMDTIQKLYERMKQ